jgi:FixJ family two-component response regulator
MRRKTGVPLIGVVDDDESVREAINNLMRSVGYRTALFASGDAFLNSSYVGQARGIILVLDVQMPGLNGLELQRRLADLKHPIPIIFITSEEDEAIRARALKQGALAFLGKPFSEQAILDAIHSALDCLEHPV